MKKTIIITIITILLIAIVCLIIFLSQGNKTPIPQTPIPPITTSVPAPTTPPVTETQSEQPPTEPIETTETPPESTEDKPISTEDKPKKTKRQLKEEHKRKEAAVKTAKDYVNNKNFTLTAHSLYSIKEYLEENKKFSAEEAEYGAENCGADWNEEAVKAAKMCLELETKVNFSYSKKELSKSIERQWKFTPEQVSYGVENCGADWNKQAENYIKVMLDKDPNIKKEHIVKTLTNKGFNKEEINHGIKACKIK
ncbi:hypothetical protein IJJ97_03955 [bacterium]|nr:hypothetical protein [bacterium]